MKCAHLKKNVNPFSALDSVQNATEPTSPVVDDHDQIDPVLPFFTGVMPSQLCFQPCRLEGLCVDVYLRYLYDEVRFISHLRRFESRSVLLQRYGLDPERLQDVLQRQVMRR